MILAWRLWLALGGLVGLLGLSFVVGYGSIWPGTTRIVVEPASCSICDARHANPRKPRASLDEGKP
jgi:hypothetical protein